MSDEVVSRSLTANVPDADRPNNNHTHLPYCTLDSDVRFGQSALMNASTRWRVQTFWQAGDETRSYAPVFMATLDDAERAAAEIAQTLQHFVGLGIRVEEVDAKQAEAERQAIEAGRAAAPKPLIHILVEGRGEALCGASLDRFNAVLSADMFGLSDGEKCAACLKLSDSV